MKHLLFGWRNGARPQQLLFLWLFWLAPLFAATVSGFSQTQPLNGPWIADGEMPAMQSVTLSNELAIFGSPSNIVAEARNGGLLTLNNSGVFAQRAPLVAVEADSRGTVVLNCGFAETGGASFIGNRGFAPPVTAALEARNGTAVATGTYIYAIGDNAVGAYATHAGNLDLTNVTLTAAGNAGACAVEVDTGSEATISASTLSSNTYPSAPLDRGPAATYVTGANSKLNLINSSITTQGNFAYGVQAEPRRYVTVQ